jgi:hypothetical protein
MIKIVCPKCTAETKISFVDGSYAGPRRCWKCHEYFTIRIENNQLLSCEPLSAEEFERQQAAKKAAEKSGGGVGFSRQEQSEFPQKAGESSRSDMNFSKREEPDLFQKAAETSRGGIDFSKREEPEIHQKTPERQPDFPKPAIPKVPSSQTQPGKPGSIFPPDKPRTFVPLEDTHKEPGKPQKPQNTPESQQALPKSSIPKVPSSQTQPGKPGSVWPPDRIRTFVPLEDTHKEPGKPQKPQNTPEPPAK